MMRTTGLETQTGLLRVDNQMWTTLKSFASDRAVSWLLLVKLTDLKPQITKVMNLLKSIRASTLPPQCCAALSHHHLAKLAQSLFLLDAKIKQSHYTNRKMNEHF